MFLNGSSKRAPMKFFISVYDFPLRSTTILDEFFIRHWVSGSFIE